MLRERMELKSGNTQGRFGKVISRSFKFRSVIAGTPKRSRSSLSVFNMNNINIKDKCV